MVNLNKFIKENKTLLIIVGIVLLYLYMQTSRESVVGSRGFVITVPILVLLISLTTAVLGGGELGKILLYLLLFIGGFFIFSAGLLGSGLAKFIIFAIIGFIFLKIITSSQTSY